jgi:quinoprotein glucose dehydrogenase
LPGWEGGATWQGAGVDPETNILYVPSARYPILAKLNTLDRSESNVDYVRSGSVSVPGPQGLPLTIPPYGSITAIDLNTGEHKWQVPHGEGVRQQVIALGIADPGPLGSADRTGPLITKTLLFVGQRDAGRTLLRAYNKDTGEVIHELELPSLAVYGTPVTYSIDGKQYITIAIGGGPQGELVTYALP